MGKDFGIPKSDIKSTQQLIEDELWKVMHKYIGKPNSEATQRKLLKLAAKTVANGIKFRIGVSNSDTKPGKITINVTPYFKGQF